MHLTHPAPDRLTPAQPDVTSLIERVRRTIRRHDLLPAGSRVVAAVSGGTDSVALVHLLLELAGAERFVVAALAHVNHRLRGDASDTDERFCRELGARLSLPVYVECVDVRGAARAGRRSVEAAARTLRYEVFARSLAFFAADRIAVGHTRDDQAETVLLKLLRGAGPRGLAAIYPQAGPVVRPLLDVGRADLAAWLDARGVDHVEDGSNQDVANPRNRIRHQVMPALIESFGRHVPRALARTAEIARADEALLEALAASARKRVVRQEAGGRLALDPAALAREPLALQRRVILYALRTAGVPHPGYADVEAVREACRGGAAGLQLAGGVNLERNAGCVVLSGRRGAHAAAPQPFRYALPVPGRIWVPEAAATLQAVRASDKEAEPVRPGDLQALIRVDPGCGLWVRSWRAGDALRPAGLGGRKKLQDLFVDRKVPRDERARLPLVVDERDRIVWVPGHAVDEAYRAASGAAAVVVLSLTRQWGGPE